MMNVYICESNMLILRALTQEDKLNIGFLHVGLANVYIHHYVLLLPIPSLLYLDMNFCSAFALNFSPVLSLSDLCLFNVDVDGRIRAFNADFNLCQRRFLK